MTVRERLSSELLPASWVTISIANPRRDDLERMPWTCRVPDFVPSAKSEEGRKKGGTKEVRSTIFKILAN